MNQTDSQQKFSYIRTFFQLTTSFQRFVLVFAEVATQHPVAEQREEEMAAAISKHPEVNSTFSFVLASFSFSASFAGDQRPLCTSILTSTSAFSIIPVNCMSSPTKRRDMDVMKLMMSSHEVQTGPGGSLAEFYVKFNGPAGKRVCCTCHCCLRKRANHATSFIFRIAILT